MAVTIPTTFKSPQFVLEVIALAAVNVLAIVSNQIGVAIGIDAAILGYHVGSQ